MENIFLTTLTVIILALLLPTNGYDEVDIGFTCTIFLDEKPHCTGTLISRMWAVTSCLCIKDTPSTRVFVRIGDPTMNGTKKHKFYIAAKTEIHPQCITGNNEYLAENDVALIMLHEPFFDSKTVFIAKLPNHLQYWAPDTEEECDLAAYTDMQDSGRTLEDAVWQTKTFVVPPAKCLEKFKDRDFNVLKNTCAYYWHKDGESHCSLDVGAPLVYQFILLGVLVHKSECGKEGAVASFVNIPLHAEWIREISARDTPWILL